MEVRRKVGAKDGRLGSSVPPITITNNPFYARFARRSPVIFVFFASAIGLLDNMNLVPKKWLRSRRAHKWTAGRTKDKEE